MTTQQRILVVEDEVSYLEALTIGLEREGFEVHTCSDGAAAVARFLDVNPDVVLLDVMLPGISGLDICRMIRGQSTVPIIMVTARSSEIDAVVGLEVGADDYVSKPYRLRELVARIRAVARRSVAETIVPAGAPDRIVRDGLVIDVDRHEISLDGEFLTLPLKEFELLVLLASNAGRVITRETLIERVWGSDYVGDTKTLDVHIRRLRSKIETSPAEPTRIATIRGVGYKFVGR